MRICWHGCARARTHALASPTPKQGYNARAVLRRGGDARGYADVARVLAWLCACAHACAPEGTPTLRMCACVGMLVRVRACVRLRIQHQRREATRVPTNGESELGEDGNSGGNPLAIQVNSDPPPSELQAHHNTNPTAGRTHPTTPSACHSPDPITPKQVLIIARPDL